MNGYISQSAEPKVPGSRPGRPTGDSHLYKRLPQRPRGSSRRPLPSGPGRRVDDPGVAFVPGIELRQSSSDNAAVARRAMLA